MKRGKAFHKLRKSIRLAGYDYSQTGAYFITICTHSKACLFGNIMNGAMNLNKNGSIAQSCWNAIPEHIKQVELDLFVVMPNHLHGILIIQDSVGARHASPESIVQVKHPVSACQLQRSPIGTIIGSFKSAVSKQVRSMSKDSSLLIWQRNYYEHVIRDDGELNDIRQYILHNPIKWELDRENPRRIGPIESYPFE